MKKLQCMKENKRIINNIVSKYSVTPLEKPFSNLFEKATFILR